MADMIVAGASNSAVNGTYVETGTYYDKPHYIKNSTYGIAWTGAAWVIYGDGDMGWREYISEYPADFATPDLVTTWLPNASPAPAPTVTAAGGGDPPSSIHEGEATLSSFSYLRTKKS